MANAQLPADLSTLTIGELEALMAEQQQHRPPDIRAVHRFTPGLYVRECRIPAGTLLTSAIHRTRHPFVISKGEIQVISPTEGAVTYTAPHTGITEPGTRRVLYAVRDTIWTTFHATDETDVDKIAEAILEPHENPHLSPDHPALSHGWKSQTAILK